MTQLLKTQLLKTELLKTQLHLPDITKDQTFKTLKLDTFLAKKEQIFHCNISFIPVNKELSLHVHCTLQQQYNKDLP